MSNRIATLLEDGTIQSVDLDKCDDVADKIIDQIIAREGEIDYDSAAVIFSLFIQSIYALEHYGWTEQELIDEINEHYPKSNE